jgi:hypothetical protein
MILVNITAVTPKEMVSIESEHYSTFVESTENDRQTIGDKQHDFHPNCKYAGVI